jgi:coproporphyrinogen III oxidase-like Fe-S oxidoreductase
MGSRPEFLCRHNLGYWRRQPYLGLGAGARSYRDGRRWWNVRPPRVPGHGGARPPPGRRRGATTPQEERLEGVFLKLRILEDVPVTSVANEVASGFVEQGLLRRVDDHFVPTERGMLLLTTWCWDSRAR